MYVRDTIINCNQINNKEEYLVKNLIKTNYQWQFFWSKKYTLQIGLKKI